MSWPSPPSAASTSTYPSWPPPLTCRYVLLVSSAPKPSPDKQQQPGNGQAGYQGTSYDRPTISGKCVHLPLPANPSHLETGLMCLHSGLAGLSTLHDRQRLYLGSIVLTLLAQLPRQGSLNSRWKVAGALACATRLSLSNGS